jgi:hypothetical protein
MKNTFSMTYQMVRGSLYEAKKLHYYHSTKGMTRWVNVIKLITCDLLYQKIHPFPNGFHLS